MVHILVPEKVNSKIKNITEDKKGYFVTIRDNFSTKSLGIYTFLIISVYVPNDRA